MWRIFTSDLRRNVTRLLCLIVGTGIGLLLIAYIYFEKTYDSSLRDYQRVYYITQNIEQNGEYLEYEQVPGGTAPFMKRMIPQIESATRITPAIGCSVVRFDDGVSIPVDSWCLADSCFFDVVGTEVISGDPAVALGVEDRCMVPRSFAEKAGRDVIGERICMFEVFPDYHAVIGGIYEDFPENSTFHNAILLSMKSIGKFTYDGTENLVGNDIYIGFLKLREGVNPEELDKPIRQMLKENYDKELIESYHYGLGIKPLSEKHSSKDGVKTKIWLLSILAFVMLLISGVNYLLIVIGQISSRSREMAVRKCFGTGNGKIFRMILNESTLYLIIAIGLGILIMFCFSSTCKELIGVTPKVLYSTGYVWFFEGVIFILLLVLTGFIPAYIYCRTPVADAFRVSVNSRRWWKLTMLSMEFAATGFLFCLVTLIVRQYRLVTDLDMGFDYENIAQIWISGINDDKALSLLEQVRKSPCVESAAYAHQNFIYSAAGDNMWTDGKEQNQVNIADMHYANSEIFETMGMEFIQGGPFPAVSDSTMTQIVVEERFIDVLHKYFDVRDDNIIGQSVHITGHGDNSQQFVVCGVIKNMIRGGFEEENADKRAGVIFPSGHSLPFLYIRFTEINPENLSSIQQILNENFKDREIYVTPYREQVSGLSYGLKQTGKSVMIVSFSILFIALLGLMGYTSDEVQRRSKEIAVRKVTGTSESKIVRLFCVDVLKVAVPSLLIGGVAAYYAGHEWVSKFTDQVHLSPLIFVACLLIIVALISVIVILNSIGVSRGNPVKYLRNE